MNPTTTPSRPREAAIAALAVVGFFAVIGGGVWLASYSTRYVPAIVNGAGSAAVYLGSLFVPASTTPVVAPTLVASTTLPFQYPATTTVATTTPVKKPPVTTHPVKPPTTTGGPESSTTYPIGGGTATTQSLYGYPDLQVSITATGYLTSTSPDSFVATSTIPAGDRPAVKFTIRNIGTNIAAPWRFSATIPTQSNYIFQSAVQQQLAPGESIDYTLGFDQANKGVGELVSVTANFDKAITESNMNNNTTSAALTILGS